MYDRYRMWSCRTVPSGFVICNFLESIDKTKVMPLQSLVHGTYVLLSSWFVLYKFLLDLNIFRWSKHLFLKNFFWKKQYLSISLLLQTCVLVFSCWHHIDVFLVDFFSTNLVPSQRFVCHHSGRRKLNKLPEAYQVWQDKLPSLMVGASGKNRREHLMMRFLGGTTGGERSHRGWLRLHIMH